MVHRDVRAQWTIEDWQAVPVTDQTDRWTTFLKTDRATPLDLTQAPIMRFALLRTAADQWKFLWSVPAILLDGWSWPLVFRDASSLYESFSSESQSGGSRLEAVRPYRDYVQWLDRQPSDEGVKFWKNNLAGYRTPVQLPSEAPEPVESDDEDRYWKHSVQLSADATEALNVAARGLHVTLNTLVQGAWAILLTARLVYPTWSLARRSPGDPPIRTDPNRLSVRS